MTKLLLGVAIGYVFHSAIDKVIQRAVEAFDQPSEEISPSEPVTPT